MQSLTQQFIAWLRLQPADKWYDFGDAQRCAFYQFAVATGIPNPNRFSYELPEQLRGPLAGNTTFGELLNELENL